MKKFQLPLIWFNLLFAIYTVLAYNGVFFQKLNEIYASTAVIIATALVLIAVLNLLFNLLFYRYTTKVIAVLLTLINGLVLYFMINYNAVIDKVMLLNVIQTDVYEVEDLLGQTFFIYFGGFGLLPAVIIALLPIDYEQGKWKGRLASMAASVLFAGALCGYGYKTTEDSARNQKPIRYALVPSNYIGSTISAIKMQRKKSSHPFVQIALDAKRTDYWEKNGKKNLFIFIVGETARAANFSLNGYSRDTNPLLARENVIAFQDVYSCGTATATSVPCMFSNMTRKNFRADNAKYTENLMDLLRQTGFDVLWLENDDGCKEVCNRVPTRKVYKSNDPRYCDGQSCFDEILLDNLEEYIASVKKDTFIVLHTIGSHGPTYYKRYPETFRKFRPTCDTADIQNCTREEIINTYDNTVLYTDSVVSRAIGILKKFPHLEAGLLYVSDHGESLGENNIYLHGLPYSIAPDEQKKIPMILWMSDTMKKLDHLDYGCIARQAREKTWSHDNLFHTLLALMEIRSSTYDRTLDIFDSCRTKPLP